MMHRAPVDISKTENEALKSASDDAGSYLESIKKTDLAIMTKDQWQEFIKIACFSYAESMRNTIETEAPPL